MSSAQATGAVRRPLNRYSLADAQAQVVIELQATRPRSSRPSAAAAAAAAPPSGSSAHPGFLSLRIPANSSSLPRGVSPRASSLRPGGGGARPPQRSSFSSGPAESPDALDSNVHSAGSDMARYPSVLPDRVAFGGDLGGPSSVAFGSAISATAAAPQPFLFGYDLDGDSAARPRWQRSLLGLADWCGNCCARGCVRCQNANSCFGRCSRDPDGAAAAATDDATHELDPLLQQQRPANWHVKVFCVVMLLFAVYLCGTSRGVPAVLQGVLGIIFSMEGLHNTTRYDLRGIRNYVIFLIIYLAGSVVISTINLNTIEFYCGTANSASGYNECKANTTFSSLMHLIGAAAITPVQILLFTAYYRAIVRYFARVDAALRAKRNYVLLREA